jgi:hypothetical protein
MSSNVTATPLPFVRIVQEAVQFLGIAGPLNHPGQVIDGAARLDRPNYSLPFLQRQLVGQL